MASKWIAGAIKHPGALHRELGVSQGHKIPKSKISAAASKGGLAIQISEAHKGTHSR